MADFARALRQGFEALDELWNARQEIDRVFERLSDEVYGFTKTVRIVRKAGSPGPTRPTQYLEAVRDGRSARLAEVACTDGGYPVEIRAWDPKVAHVAGETYIAGTREELEAALEALLQDPRVAEAIRRLAQA